MTFLPGTRLGPYEILGPLGAGGMGTVYRAKDPRLNRDVAIKVVSETGAEDAGRRKLLEQEARIVGRLNHPNIAAIHDLGEVPSDLPGSGSPFLVMELLQGQSLREVLRNGPLPSAKAIQFARETALALAAAHDSGVVHRDLKPENLFVQTSGVLKILDFGIAKLQSRDGKEETRTNPTEPGTVVGTLTYMSPEQARGLPVDHRTDIFSLGSVIYEMVGGTAPFRRATVADTVAAILNEEPPSLAQSGSAPEAEGVDTIVRRCLAKEPGRRFQSAHDLAFSLEGVGRSTGTSRPPSPPRRQTDPFRAVLLVLLAVIGLAGAFWFRNSRSAKTSPNPGPARLTPLLSTAAVETNPAWSADGDLIAYVSETSGNPDVWISDPGTTRAINLTADHPGVDAFPVWAPDGGRIAFYSDRAGGGIFVMSALGGNVQRVVEIKPSILYTFSLRWSRDGRLVYTDFMADGTKRILAVSPSGGGEPACLSCALDGLSSARAGDLSPSGALLALTTSPTDALSSVLVADLGTGKVHTIAGHSDWPQWRGDDRLMFVSLRDGIADLWEVVVDPNTGEAVGAPYRLTSGFDLSVVGPFSVRSDGSVLAVKEKTAGNLWRFSADRQHLGDAEAEGVPVTSGAYRDTHPRWLHNDTGVVFQSDRRGSVELWTVVPGQEPTRLTSATMSAQLGNAYRPVVAPSGRWIAVEVVGEGGSDLHLIKPNGTDLHTFEAQWHSVYEHVCCLDWSGDGRRAALSYRFRRGGNGLGIVAFDDTTGTAVGPIRPLLQEGRNEYAKWSPDGRFLVFESFSEGSWDLWISDVEGRSPRRLTRFPGNERSAVWRADPLSLYFRRDFREIWRLPMNSDGTPAGPAEVWMSFPGKTFDHNGLDFTQAGDAVVVTLLSRASDIWLAELGAPKDP